MARVPAAPFGSVACVCAAGSGSWRILLHHIACVQQAAAASASLLLHHAACLQQVAAASASVCTAPRGSCVRAGGAGCQGGGPAGAVHQPRRPQSPGWPRAHSQLGMLCRTQECLARTCMCTCACLRICVSLCVFLCVFAFLCVSSSVRLCVFQLLCCATWNSQLSQVSPAQSWREHDMKMMHVQESCAHARAAWRYSLHTLRLLLLVASFHGPAQPDGRAAHARLPPTWPTCRPCCAMCSSPTARCRARASCPCPSHGT